jgi:hypothetical protein
VYQRTAGLRVLENSKKIISLFACELYFYAVVDTEVETHVVIELPAKQVIFQGGHNTQQPGIFEEVFFHFFYVQLEFHWRRYFAQRQEEKEIRAPAYLFLLALCGN